MNGAGARTFVNARLVDPASGSDERGAILVEDGRIKDLGPDLVVQKRLINRAARRVLDRRAWSFLHRDDGFLFLPGSLSTTATLTNGLVGGVLSSSLAAARPFSAGSTAANLLLTDSSFPQTSFRVTDIGEAISVPRVTLKPGWGGSTGVFTATLYANSAALPSTVARVLSIRNEENWPIRFETVDTFDDFERLVPEDGERFGDTPELVAVGGQVVSTSRSSSSSNVSAQTGIGVRVYPSPSENIYLRYSYVRRVTELAEDTDELQGVPAEVQDHIVNVAFEIALMSNIEDDPRRGERVRVQNEHDYRNLVSADKRDVGRRRIPRPFSGRVHLSPVERRTLPEP